MKLTFLTLMFLLSSSPIFAGSFTFTAGSGSIVPGTVDIMNHCDGHCTALPIRVPMCHLTACWSSDQTI
jgi:hypothetical protein